jgi:hypothetical protein
VAHKIMKKVRIIQFIVQPIAVIDDGENLIPVEVKPIPVLAASWKKFAENGADDLLGQLQAQIDEKE